MFLQKLDLLTQNSLSAAFGPFRAGGACACVSKAILHVEMSSTPQKSSDTTSKTGGKILLFKTIKWNYAKNRNYWSNCNK